MENNKINEENELKEKEFCEDDQLSDAEEIEKIKDIIQNILDNKILKIIKSELRKNKIKSSLEIELTMDIDIYKNIYKR